MGIFSELAKSFSPEGDAFVFMWFLATLGTIAIFIVAEKYLHLRTRTDYNASSLFDKLRVLIENKRLEDALKLCQAGKIRALPRILGAGIQKAISQPTMAAGAIAAETTHVSSAMERRLGFLVMFGNVSTLLGLLGTVFGLIMSFTAVSRPGVAAVEKSSMLAAGISAAMNSTLVGLSISVPCVLAYSFLRARVDSVLQEIDRYSLAIMNLLNPNQGEEGFALSMRRSREQQEAADTDVTPMLNLMVMLIPFLLTSSEFVKIGNIELKLPEAQGAGEGGGDAEQQQQETKLDLGIVITNKGFNLFHYFKPAGTAGIPAEAEIPILAENKYDFEGLTKKLSEIKQKALFEIVKAYAGDPGNAPLSHLYTTYLEKKLNGTTLFADHEDMKIVAQENIKYQTIVSVMDAARSISTPDGPVTMFPNVSITVGVIP